MKQFLIVTLYLNCPTFDYDRLFNYLRGFDSMAACAPSATNKSVFLATNTPEKEILEQVARFIAPGDFCAVDSYDSATGGPEISAAAQRILEWVAT